MRTLEWSDMVYSRELKPFLLFIKGDEIVSFAGKNILDVVGVYGAIHNRVSLCTTYRLMLVKNDVRYIAGWNGWKTGGFAEGLGYALNCPAPHTWADTAKVLGVSIPGAMKFLRSWQPKEAENLDEIEQGLKELGKIIEEEVHFTVTNIVEVLFSSPDYKVIRDGHLESPKPIPGYKAEIRLTNQDNGWVKENIGVFGISGVVLSVQHNCMTNNELYAVYIAVISWKGGISVFPNHP